jgi:hypothetical protein
VIIRDTQSDGRNLASARWLASASASAFHAAELLARGEPLVDAALAEALLPAAMSLATVVAERCSDPAAFFAHLVPRSATIDSNRQLAEVVLAKTLGPSRPAGLVDRFAGLFTELEAAFVRALPDAVDELALRSEPLREQWEARGPGLLASVRRLTEPDIVPDQADVILVHPVQGGGGRAYLPYNSLAIEAVLANPSPELPEVARLGWLWSQLNADLPKFQGEIPRPRLAMLAAFATLPPILQAAEDVELAAFRPESLAHAIEVWRLPAAELAVDSAHLAGILGQWWETYLASRPAWAIALAALDRMLAESTS